MTLALMERAKTETAQSVRFMLVVEYDGTRYGGSQRQQNAPTVQAELERALGQLTGEEIKVSLAGRTDAGVHARGQVASFTTRSPLPAEAYVGGLNHFLPRDIAVKEAQEVAASFDPRRTATRREYEYVVLTSPTRSPLWEGRAYHLPGPLGVAAMDEAARLLVGSHDFASFSAQLPPGKSSVRRIFEASVRREGELVLIRLAGNAFLPHQVRVTAGTLLRVGKGQLSPAGFKEILEARQPSLAGPTAPACGLYLNRVYYDKNSSPEKLRFSGLLPHPSLGTRGGASPEKERSEFSGED